MNFSFKQFQKNQLESLLNRTSFEIIDKDTVSYLKDKSVLVTGAGGSIGKELVLQIAKLQPSSIHLLDIAETPLFESQNELMQLNLKPTTTSFIGDIKNLARIDYIFQETKPKILFHAAAYKHVPMMEKNPCEAILNNLEGTIHLIHLAIKHKIEKFIFISTDKAVNPKNIMGASKRICELYIQNLKPETKVELVTVRFGNVLGSNGSVLPIFFEQIQKGGPVTITHPEISRFFMTIPEAIHLVLQAGGIGKEKEIFVLDMGQPIKIKELAEKMIELAGFKPYTDIKIDFIGIRPGEKLFEELKQKTETLQKTNYPRILMNQSTENANEDKELFFQKVEELLKVARQNKVHQISPKIREIIPDYKT